jgi:hypothetical protein
LARSGDLAHISERVTLEDGTVIRCIANEGLIPILEIYAPPREEDITRSFSATSLLKWLPEGFVIRPKDAVTNVPWGVPSTGYGEITPGGPLNDVLINQAPDNFYPDALFAAFQPGRPRVIDTTAISVGYTIAPYAHLVDERVGLFLPEITAGETLKSSFWDESLVVFPEIAEESGYARQVSIAYDQLIRLPQSDEFDPENPNLNSWYAHRAEFMPFVSDVAEAEELGLDTFVIDPIRKDIFDYTNQVRAANGRKPLLPPLRGVYNGVAEAIVREVTSTGSYGHDSPEFRDGYRFVFERLLTYGAGNSPQYFEVLRAIIPFGSENIQFDSSPEPAVNDSLGTYFAKAWENSPPHFQAMIADYFDEDSDPSRNTAGTHQISLGGATVNNIAESAALDGGFSGALPDPLTGTFAAQIFQAPDTAYQSASRAWYGDNGRTLTFGAPPIHEPVPVLHRTDREAFSSIIQRFDAPVFVVYHRGHPIPLEHPTREARPDLTTFKGDITGVTPIPEGDKDGARLLAACLVEGENYLIVRVAALYAPEDWSEQPQIIISDYAVNEPVYTDARLLTSTAELLPQETCGITAEFSPSGERCVASVHVREPSPNSSLRYEEADLYVDRDDYATAAFNPETAPGVMYGTSITHREFVASTATWTVFPKQELMVTPVTIRPLLNETYSTSIGTLVEGNAYHVTCSGEYDAIAAYDGEDIVYVRINVDYEQHQWGGWLAPDEGPDGGYLLRDKIKLIFPDEEGTELWLRNFDTVDRLSDLTGTGFEDFQLPNVEDHVVSPFSHDAKWHNVVGWDYNLLAIDPLDPTMTVRRQIEVKGCITTERTVFGEPDPSWNAAILAEWDSPLAYWRIRQRTLQGADTELLPWRTAHEFSAPEHVYEGGVFTRNASGFVVSGQLIATTHSTLGPTPVPLGYPRTGEINYPNDPQYPRNLVALFSPKPFQVISGRTSRDVNGDIVVQDSTMRCYGHYSFDSASITVSPLPNQHGVFPSTDKCAVAHHANITPSIAGLSAPHAYTQRLGLEGLSASCYEQATTVYGGSYSLTPYLTPPSVLDALPDGKFSIIGGDISPFGQNLVYYKGEYLLSGIDVGVVNHRVFDNNPDGSKGRSYFASSLDIRAILGGDEISDDIFPVTVL